MCLLPGTVIGIVLAAALLAAGQPLVALGVLVVSVVAVAALVWRWAPGTVARSLGARPSEEWEHPRLHNLVDGLCATMGLDRPRVLVVESGVPNAMAIGRDPASAILVVTSALDRVLGLVELEGVLAHELVHIKRHDTVLAGVAVMVTAPWAVVRGTPAGVRTVHRLIGPGREFSADQRARRGGALSTRHLLGTPDHARVGLPGGRMATVDGTGRRPHPMALGRPDGRVVLPRVVGREPRRHQGPSRRPLSRLTARQGLRPGLAQIAVGQMTISSSASQVQPAPVFCSSTWSRRRRSSDANVPPRRG